MGGPGSGGHNRKPLSLHKLAGTERPARHHRTLADLPIGALGSVGPPPSWLPPEGKRLWRQLRPRLEQAGILTALDKALFVALCQVWSSYVVTVEQLRQADLVIKTPRGVERVHPLVVVHLGYLSQFLALTKEFGLSPLSRKRLSLPPSPQAPDPFEAFLNGNSERP